MDKKFYITTAISYPNGNPHIGHAYEAIAADILARFKRLDGYEVFFLTGTDDHGQKIYRTAQEKKISPQKMTDEISQNFIDMCTFFNISNDRFIRTSEQTHHEAVRAIWRKLEEKGDIYKDKYEGWYCVREEEFYTENELVKNERGEWQTPTNSPVEWVKEDSYFFRLSKYQERLLRYYEKFPNFVEPKTRLNEITSFVKGGLLDISISRSSFDWGVKAPTEDNHIAYVWLDALTNYITACGYPNKEMKFWPADLHLIGKDILRFHAVYWPAFLMSAELELPKKIFAHGMVLTSSGEKMSKSLDNVIDPFEQAKKYGVDGFRYFLLSSTPFGQDGAYSETRIIAKLNADLANNLGNLAQRCLTMIQKHWQGKVPPITGKKPSIYNQLPQIREAINNIAPHIVLTKILEEVSNVNRYFAAQKPWELEGDAQSNVLGFTLEALRQIAILLQPFMPDKMEELLDCLAIPKNERNFEALTTSQIKTGTQLPAPKPIFPRI